MALCLVFGAFDLPDTTARSSNVNDRQQEHHRTLIAFGSTRISHADA